MNYPTYPNQYQPQGYLRYGQNPYQQMTIQQPMIPQQPQGYSPASMPVSSREEAMAVPADFSGAPMVFTDFSHEKVYIKQWNSQKGAADFFVFTPEVQSNPEEISEAANENFITKSDFRREMEKVFTEIKKLRGEEANEHEG